MAVKTRSRVMQPSIPVRRPSGHWRFITVIVLLVTGVALAGRALPRLLPQPTGPIAPLFTAEVRYWAGDIQRWSTEYSVEPALLATVMQIESCGHPTVSSYAGAQGLFQVMPFHFATGENQLDPDTNARHSADVLQQCSVFAKGDVGLTLACYNGGPRVTQIPYDQWRDQTQRYVVWGMGIYADAITNQSRSAMLDAWLNAGGARLCAQASTALGL